MYSLFILNYTFASELTFPIPINFGVVTPNTNFHGYFEIENNTKDTFFIKKIGNIFGLYPNDIYFKGNRIYSSSIWEAESYSAKLILPNEKRAISYEIQSTYVDSISLSGSKLNTGFFIEYHKYNSDSILKGNINISFSVKKFKDTIFVNSSGLLLDVFRCPGSENFLHQSYIVVFNNFDKNAKVDSIKYWGGDSIVNYYGVINNLNRDISYPKIFYDSLPFVLKSNSIVSIGWYVNNIGYNSKKAFLNVYITDPNNKQIIIKDSLFVRFKYEHGALIENIDHPIFAKIFEKKLMNESILISTCSFYKHTLDSITFVGWDKGVMKIVNPFGFPMKLESGFNYPLSYEFIPNKADTIIGKFVAHFRDENDIYYYRYVVVRTNTAGTTDISLSPDTPIVFYPNPVNSLATLLLDEEPSVGEKVCIYNSLGTLVKTFEVSNKYTQVNTEGFAEGVYIARLMWSGKSVKFTVVR